ncbi:MULTISPECIES: M20 family metallopeptidase [Brevibacillus]|uniref:M20 family metallopeptidase n=1 Tax=Brevibacillus TaxID=55080 RepID=UPI000F0839CC|nr:M20 family metallopeptidase [Brevibacillus borstelensis]MED1881409.1 M20 family metallopeptidase [Brevibacillus borstelensis]NOU53604.1 M20 family metallopeptidase [Brevibacillus borstelensis]RNB66677.1 M20 family peptidase [Brevibacillus borstelensis]GED52424.1 peptidase M20 [Brevibacillus borstelensis]
MDIHLLLQQYQQQLIEDLRQCVNMDSPSRSKALGDRMADWFGKRFVELTGGQAERIANEQYGDQLRCVLGNGEKRVLVIGHYDTVWPEGEADRRPFAIKNGRAYGPGVYDMKAGVLQAFYALRALQELGQFPADKQVVLLLNSDEEIGSPTSRRLVEREAEGAVASFVLEPPTEPHGALKTWRKGSAHFQLRVHGVSSHAGVDHAKGVSAIEEMSRIIQYLHTFTDYEVGTTVNVGLVKGGIGSNVVADFAEAEVDVRVMTLEAARQMEQLFHSLQPSLPGTRLTVTGGMRRPPMERTDKIGRLFALAKSIAEQEIGIELEESGTGGVSDGNFAAACGVPTLDGLGAKGGYAHSPDEFIEIDQIPVRSALLARLIERC